MSLAGAPTLKIRLVGPLSIERDGQELAIPASRKARAILGYLILSSRPVSRQRLCDLFFDAPDDPRASLRWTLTKLRPLVDDYGAPRIVTVRDTLSFDPAGADIDALRLLAATPSAGVDEALAQLLMQPSGPLLEDGELADRADFSAWLSAAREDVRFAMIRGLRAMLANTPERDRALPLYRRWLSLDPLDETANRDLIGALAQLGRAEEAQTTLAAAERALMRAGIKPSPNLRAALHAGAQTQPAPQATPAARPSASTLLDALPGVAVLPFHNFSTAEVSTLYADGFLESVIHMLSRFSSHRVADMDAVLRFREQMPDPASLSRATGADYIVGGSFLVRDGRAKLRYRIVEGQSGNLLRNGEIDTAFDDANCMLDSAPTQLAIQLAHQLQELARAKAVSTPPHARGAMEHFFCGVTAALQLPRPDYEQALVSLNEAIALKPDFPRALAYSALIFALTGKARRDPAVHTEALARANAAIAIGNDDATALSIGAQAIIYIAGAAGAGAALAAVDKAVRINPLTRAAWNASAWIRTYCDEYEAPMAHWAQGEACNPMEMWMDAVNCGRALCCWQAGRYAEVREWAERGLELVPANANGLCVLLACAVESGDQMAIDAAARRLLAHHPNAAAEPPIAALPLRNKEKHAALIAAVQAGLS